MDLRYYLDVLRQRWALLLLPPLVAFVASFFISESLTDIYQGEVTLLVNQTEVQGVVSYQDILGSERITNTYAELVVQHPILTPVIEELNLPYTLEEFEDEIDVEVLLETQLVQIRAKDPDPAMAAIITNLWAEKFIESNDADLRRPGVVTIVSPSIVPEERAEPKVLLIVAVAGAFGLLISLGMTLVMENLARGGDLLEVRRIGEAEHSGGIA